MNIKILLLISIVSTAYCESKLQQLSKTQNLTSSLIALNDVVDIFYNGSIPFNILFHENKTYKNSELLHEKFLAQNNEKFSFRINEMRGQDIFHKISAIIFVYSCDFYKLIHWTQIPLNIFQRTLKYLVYIEDCRLKQVKNYLKMFIKQHKLTFFRSMIEVFELLLIDDDDYLHLMTIEYFTKEVCNEPQLNILNSFNKTTQKWTKRLENYEKFRNFHGCELVMMASYNPKEGRNWMNLIFNEESITPVGLVPHMFELIKKVANYKTGYEFIYPKGPSTFHCTQKYIRMYIDNATHNNPNVCFSFSRSDAYSIEHWELHYMTPFMEIREVIVTTPGELYSAYEKLLLPFDELTWILFIFTFVVAFLFIFIVNLLPKSMQDTFYGSNVKTPAINVVSTFFGIPQNRVPKLNFPRFILMNFILFCLIFRTCYQSKMFQFMTSTPRRPQPNSIMELDERGFKIYVMENSSIYRNMLKHKDGDWPKVKQMSHIKFCEVFYTQSQNSSAKLGLIIQNHAIIYEELYAGKKLNWHMLTDSLQVSGAGFAFYANNFFSKVIDRVIKAWIPAGIMDKIMTEFLGNNRNFVTLKKPMVLKMDNLRFGFSIWLGCCGFCLAIFIIESLIFAIKTKFITREKQQKIRKMNFAKVYPMKVQKIEELVTKTLLFTIPEEDIDNLELLNADNDIIEHETVEKF